jgi:hypothetical protein
MLSIVKEMENGLVHPLRRRRKKANMLIKRVFILR